MSNDAQCTNSPTCNNNPTASQLRLYQTFIFATPILFSFVLLFLFCLLYLRRRRNAIVASHIRAQFFARGLFATPLDHGLNKSFRDNIPTVVFDTELAEAGVDTQCAVCLGDYQLNEKLQKLPACGHTFHLDCIDEWLAGNSTCPICRTSLLQAGRVVPVTSSPSYVPSPPPPSTSQQQEQCRDGGEVEASATSKQQQQESEKPSTELGSHVIRID